jgi:hypothetical protein
MMAKHRYAPPRRPSRRAAKARKVDPATNFGNPDFPGDEGQPPHRTTDQYEADKAAGIQPVGHPTEKGGKS